MRMHAILSGMCHPLTGAGHALRPISAAAESATLVLGSMHPRGRCSRLGGQVDGAAASLHLEGGAGQRQGSREEDESSMNLHME